MTRHIISLGIIAGVLAGCGDGGEIEAHAHGGGAAAAAADRPSYDPRTAYGPDQHILIAADDIQWQPGPASLEHGAEHVVLEGDPSTSGMFVMRLKLPDGFVIRPHTHPNVERVTVMAGTFHLGHGAEFDRDAANRLPAGSFTSMPPGMQHYAIAEGETVIQLTSIGPWEIHYINPEDDPRNAGD